MQQCDRSGRPIFLVIDLDPESDLDPDVPIAEQLPPDMNPRARADLETRIRGTVRLAELGKYPPAILYTYRSRDDGTLAVFMFRPGTVERPAWAP